MISDEVQGIRHIVGPTIMLRSGVYFDFEAPEDCAISISDIAWSLAHLCRFTGHTQRFYSVAEHSVHCSHLVPEEDAFAALMHDAVEAVVGDMSRPLKSLLPGYKEIEKRCEAAILARFGLPAELPESVKRADVTMLDVERRHAMGAGREHWPGITGASDGIRTPRIEFWLPRDARIQFLARFTEVCHA